MMTETPAEMEPTAGPWSFVSGNMPNPVYFHIQGADGGYIAAVNAADGDSVNGIANGPLNRANAALLAQAPAMKEALRDLTRTHNVRGEDGPCECAGCRIVGPFGALKLAEPAS